MKTRSFVISVFLVGSVALTLIVAGHAIPAMAQIRQSFPTPTSTSTHSPVTATWQTADITTTMVDVGQFTSGALECDWRCRIELGLVGQGRWLTPSTGVALDVAVPCAYPLPDGMCVYYGDLHSHTGYSDGQGTPEQAYQMARDNGMDFFATTDHAEQLSGDEWNITLALAQAATVEDHFIALRGFEWTSNYGHINVFNTAKRVRSNDSRYNTIPEFYAWLSDPARINSVAQFDHPFYPEDPFDNWQYDALADGHVNLIEARNGNFVMIEEYHEALAAGWHVGAVSNSDTHLPNWGERRARTGIIAPGLAYHHVINALHARRTFSTDDENLILALRANGSWMGSVIGNGPVYFDVYAFDPDPSDPIATLELFWDGYPFQSVIVNTHTFTWSVALPAPPPPGTWWYVKATQSDGDEAYTSPVWTWQPKSHDVLIRDNVWDIGDVPSLDPVWQSPDIWVRHQADGQIWHENPLAGQVNYVYARVRNVGSNPVMNTDLYLYWSPPALGFTWPTDWTPINPTPIRLQDLAPGESVVVSVPWNVSASVPAHACLLARLTSPQDPITYDGYPQRDNNIGWKNVHIVDLSDTPPSTDSLVFEDVAFYVANPFSEDKAADVRIYSSDFPVTGSLALHLDTALFDRWMSTVMSGVVKGAIVYPVSRTIVITSATDAAVYGLPLLARESSTATLAIGVPPSATLAIRVSEYVDGNEIGGNLYTTFPSGVPQWVYLEAAEERIASDQSIVITATVAGEGFVPVVDGTQVRLSTSLGNLSTDTVHTHNGIATATLSTGSISGTVIVRAYVDSLFPAAVPVAIYPVCQARLNGEPAVYSTLQAAVDASTHPTDIVKVAGRCSTIHTRGDLSQVVYISKTVTVRGGYTFTNWTTPDPAAHPTVLDAEGQGRAIYVTGAGISLTIEGLHITGGDAAGLGGGPAGADVGGGVYVVSATATIRGSWVSSNTADYGGGVYLASGNHVLINSVVADNRGGGLYVEGGTSRLLHTTIARNGSGVYVANAGADHSAVWLTNTILVSHTVGITVAAGSTATLEATLWGGGDWSNDADWGGAGAIITGAHNYRGDPVFAAPHVGDYHLGEGSAAINAGVDAGVTDDVDGELRPMGHGYDIGADELLIELAVAKQAVVHAVPAGVQLIYTIRVTNTGRMGLHATVADTLPFHIMPGETPSGTLILPGGTLVWSPIITSAGVWTQQVAVTVERGYAGSLTNVVQVVTDEGAAGVYTHTLVLSPSLELSVHAAPDPVRAGELLVYTIHVTNTGSVELHATVTDMLPTHIMTGGTAGGTLVAPGATLTWTPVITVPGGVWAQTVAVTVETGYAGPLTNVVQVTTSVGAAGVHTTTTTAIVRYPLYMPVVMRNFYAPELCAPRLIATVATGPDSYRVALDAATRRAFVAHAEGVTVVDADSFAVITTTRLLILAHGVTYDPDHDRIWVTGKNPDRVVVIDGATYAPLADLPAGNDPHDVAYNPANGYVYVSNWAGWTVSVYDAATMAHVTDLTGFAEPAHIAVNPVTNKIYVTNHRPYQGVSVINGATHIAQRISTTLLDAYGITVDTTRNLVYAVGIAQGRIVVIDGAADVQLGDLDIHSSGHAVWLRAIAINPYVGLEGHLMVVTSSNDGELDQLLLIPNGWPTLGAPASLGLPSYPQEGIALDPATNRVWVTSVSSGLVSIVQDGEPVCPAQ
jgi:uncharacterized repeat protein (TIGR01451 family)